MIIKERSGTIKTRSQLKPGDIFSWGVRADWYIVTNNLHYVDLDSGHSLPLAMLNVTNLVVAQSTELSVEV